MNKLKLLLGGTLLASAMAAGPVSAQQDWYMSLGGGDAEDEMLNASDTGWRLAGGGYFSRYFGVELSLVSLGAPEAGGVEYSQGGLAIFGLGRLPIGKRFDVFTKLGYLSWNVTASGAIAGEADGKDPAWGLGAGVNINDKFRIEIQHERFMNILDSDVDMLSLSGVLRFE